jgi:hypothetical protein
MLPTYVWRGWWLLVLHGTGTAVTGEGTGACGRTRVVEVEVET